jgi:putative OPT family oligopeptide transporter
MSGVSGFQPHVPPHEEPPELTLRAVLLGAVLGIIFGASSTYLALRVGLTVSASVPIAVIAIALLRPRRERAILEHNITQTVGSAGESVAAALVFTVPALIFLGYPLRVELSTLIALTGGMLGVLMMVPLRRYLIVKEHGVLRYPEGKACAEILIAGEKGGMSARKVFFGMGVGAAFKTFQGLLGGVKGTLSRSFEFFKGASLACDIDPTLLGVGYIIGYRTSMIMVSGSLLASLILVPIIVLFGSGLSVPLAPATELIRNMQPADVWDQYVRHIGAGAVATGGIFGLIRALPVILSSLRASARSLTGSSAAEASSLRTDRDTPTPVLVFGALGIVGFITALPAFNMNLLGAALILVLGFLFSVVSSRITGEVGSTSSPLSGMTIGVLMATCGVFLAVGWEGSAYSRLALMIGAVVCIAISNAGTCSQDLKTGFLVGATPVRQQVALLIGVLASVLAVGWTAYGLNNADATERRLDQPFTVKQELIANADTIASRSDNRTYRYVRLAQDEVPPGMKPGVYLVDESSGKAAYSRQDGVGGPRFPAPQARLMSVVIDGLLTHRLPWNLILIGVAIALFMELLGFGSLTFAVGVYLPLSSTMPVFLGGVVRKLCDRIYRRPPDDEAEKEGTLFCSGLIAGASIIGIFAAMQGFLPGFDPNTLLHPNIALLLRVTPAWDNPLSDLWGIALLGVLGFLMFRSAREPQ